MLLFGVLIKGFCEAQLKRITGGKQHDSVCVCFVAQFLQISMQAAYCCLEFAIVCVICMGQMKTFTLYNFFNLLSRTFHMLIRLIKITKC